MYPTEFKFVAQFSATDQLRVTNSLLCHKLDHNKRKDCQKCQTDIEEIVVEHSFPLGPSELVHGEGRTQSLKDGEYKEDDEEKKDANDRGQAIVRLL